MNRLVLAVALCAAVLAATPPAWSQGAAPDGKAPEPARAADGSVVPDTGRAGAPPPPLDCTKTPDRCLGQPITAPGAATGNVSPSLPAQSK